MQLNKPEWKSVSAASFCSFVSGFAMPLLAVILGDFISVSNIIRYNTDNANNIMSILQNFVF